MFQYDSARMVDELNEMVGGHVPRLDCLLSI